MKVAIAIIGIALTAITVLSRVRSTLAYTTLVLSLRNSGKLPLEDISARISLVYGKTAVC